MATEESALLEVPLSAVEQAAWIIDETLRGNSASIENIPKTSATRHMHLQYERYAYLRVSAAFVLFALTFFEVPAWCGPEAKCFVLGPDGEPAKMYMSGTPMLPPRVASLIEFAAIIILAYNLRVRYTLLHNRDEDSHATRTFPWLTACLVVLSIDAAYALVFPVPPFRVAPYIRAVLPLFYWPSLLETARGVQALLRPFLDVLLFWVLFVLLTGWISTLMFHDVPGAERYWKDLPTGLLSSFIVGTGADYPMQIMAPLEANRHLGWLFMLEVVISIFLLFNFVLAVVYSKYTEFLEENVLENFRRRNENLKLAFSLLSPSGGDGITLEEFKPVVVELSHNPSVQINEDQLDLIFLALDDNGDRVLDIDEFTDLLTSLELQFDDFSLQQKSFLEDLAPWLYENNSWLSLMEYVRSRQFERAIDMFMVFNLVVILIESSMDLRNTDTPATVLFFGFVEFTFCLVYLAESFLKISAMSWKSYWSNLGNRFDFIVNLLLTLGCAYVILPVGDNSPELIRYLVCLRCLRLLALLSDIPRFTELVRIFSLLLPASIPLLSLFFISLYIFSVAGVQLFGGIIYEGNPALDPEKHELVDAYIMNQYMSLNMNDMSGAIFVHFTAVVVCYLTEVPAAVASAVGSDWTHWYFLLAFAVNTLIISNVVLSLVVDLFVDAKESLSEDGAEFAEMAELQSRYTAHGKYRVTKKTVTADGVFAGMFRDRVKELAMARDESVASA